MKPGISFPADKSLEQENIDRTNKACYNDLILTTNGKLRGGRRGYVGDGPGLRKPPQGIV